MEVPQKFLVVQQKCWGTAVQTLWKKDIEKKLLQWLYLIHDKQATTIDKKLWYRIILRMIFCCFHNYTPKSSKIKNTISIKTLSSFWSCLWLSFLLFLWPKLAFWKLKRQIVNEIIAQKTSCFLLLIFVSIRNRSSLFV